MRHCRIMSKLGRLMQYGLVIKAEYNWRDRAASVRGNASLIGTFSSVLYPCEAKNRTVLFLQYLYQTALHSDNFWHTYTTIKLLSPVYFIYVTS